MKLAMMLVAGASVAQVWAFPAKSNNPTVERGYLDADAAELGTRAAPFLGRRFNLGGWSVFISAAARTFEDGFHALGVNEDLIDNVIDTMQRDWGAGAQGGAENGLYTFNMRMIRSGTQADIGNVPNSLLTQIMDAFVGYGQYYGAQEVNCNIADASTGLDVMGLEVYSNVRT